MRVMAIQRPLRLDCDARCSGGRMNGFMLRIAVACLRSDLGRGIWSARGGLSRANPTRCESFRLVVCALIRDFGFGECFMTNSAALWPDALGTCGCGIRTDTLRFHSHRRAIAVLVEMLVVKSYPCGRIL